MDNPTSNTTLLAPVQAQEQTVISASEDRKVSVFWETMKGGLIAGGISVGIGAFIDTVFNKEAWKHPFNEKVKVTAGILDAGLAIFGGILYGRRAYKYNHEVDERSHAQRIKQEKDAQALIQQGRQ